MDWQGEMSKRPLCLEPNEFSLSGKLQVPFSVLNEPTEYSCRVHVSETNVRRKLSILDE